MDVVVIPAYEPDDALCDIVEQMWEYGCEVVVVDDGSGEAYQLIFERIRDISVVLHNEKNYGKGVAIRTALSYIQDEMCDCEFVGVMDADGQHLPEDMIKVLAEVKNHADALVLGVRNLQKGMPIRSLVGNWLTRRVFRIVTKVAVTDTQTGLRAFHRDQIPMMLEIKGARYEYEMNVLVEFAKQDISIREIPIHTVYRDKGNSTSHFRAIVDSVRIYGDLFRFGLISFSSFVLDYLLFLILLACIGTPFGRVLLANILARFISAFYNYRMNCRFVFRKKPDLETVTGYFALACGILFANNIILEVLSQGMGIPVKFAKIMTEILLFLGSWFVQRCLIFRKKKIVTHKGGMISCAE